MTIIKRILMVSRELSNTGKHLGKGGREKGRERNGPFSSSHTALLSAIKDNRQNTRRQDEVLQLITA